MTTDEKIRALTAAYDAKVAESAAKDAHIADLEANAVSPETLATVDRILSTVAPAPAN